IVAGNERVDGRAELLELRRGKAAKRRERKIDKGDARVRWDCLDIGPDTPRLVTNRVRCRAAKIGELFFTDSRILGEQKGAHQSVGAERITHRRLDGRRHSLMKVDGVLKMFGPRLADVRDDSYLGYARKRRRTRTGQ